MRKPLIIVVALFAVAVFAGPVLGGSSPALTSAPDHFQCNFTTVSALNDTVECSWDMLTDATKYSVDVVANYDLGGGGTMSADFDFGTSLFVIDIPLSSFPTDINGDTVADTLLSLVLRVKGLNPPAKNPHHSQNNQFSGTFTCTISSGTCSSP